MFFKIADLGTVFALSLGIYFNKLFAVIAKKTRMRLVMYIPVYGFTGGVLK
jgi:hypothetical protein